MSPWCFVGSPPFAKRGHKAQAQPEPQRVLFGLHEPGGEHLMRQAGQLGWIVFTFGLGADPNNTQGVDMTPWADFGIIARINHGYGPQGTIPLPQQYAAFAVRVRQFVAHSPGCRIWIIGNEPNHPNEWHQGQPISPSQYAQCYRLCKAQIHSLPGHQADLVVPAALAPWIDLQGDWLWYFEQQLQLCQPIGGIALHTYTHGPDPALITSEVRMGAPYGDRCFNFRAYRDFLGRVPAELQQLPVWITECAQVPSSAQDPPRWHDQNSGWVQRAYSEIKQWNTGPGHQQIRALVLYRWPKYDPWHIDGRMQVQADFLQAMRQ